MIKSLLILIFLGFILKADDNYELKLYEKVIPLILDSKIIYVYADYEVKEIIKSSSILHLKNECKDIDLIISKKIGENIKCKGVAFFATSYNSYKNSTNAIGAFYWRKGRPQLQLNQENIKKFNLSLPESLEKYAK